MTGVGTHSKPVDGIPVANGHAPSLAAFTIPSELQVRQGGPMATWPQPDATAATVKTGWWRQNVAPWLRAIFAHRAWLAAIPVILVNAVAFSGQLAFLRGHLPWPLAGQVLVAVTLESVAVYLAWQAHLALAADDSALRLRLAAYGFAAVIGVMNFSHYAAPHWRPTFAAVTFGLMSVSSPWLWSVHSRRVSRDALKARGLIEPHAVRLGATRWTWHPWRSACVMWHATWVGENDPVKAIALRESVAPVVVPDDGSDDGDERQDRDEDSDTASDTDTSGERRDERQDLDTDSDTEEPPRQRRQRQDTPSASDKVSVILRRSKRLRDLLASDSAADRKAAKDELAEKMTVSVRTVERALSELAGTKS